MRLAAEVGGALKQFLLFCGSKCAVLYEEVLMSMPTDLATMNLKFRRV